jgi:hypothetical protein
VNFRAGRDFRGDLTQSLHFISKEVEIPRDRPCPRSDTRVSGAGNEKPELCCPELDLIPAL